MLRKIIAPLTIIATLIISVMGTIYLIALQQKVRSETFEFYSSLDDTLFLDQNWNANTRQQVNFTSFGSRMLPLD